MSILGKSAAKRTEELLWEGRRVVAGALAAALGHELRNVLAVVLGGVDYLTRERLPARAASLLRHVHDAAERGADLARDLTRRADGVLGTDPVDTDLGLLAAGVLDLLRPRGAVLQAKPRVLARVCPPLVRQILVELLANAAAAAGPRGRIEVHVTATAGGAPVLEVHDSGPGFPDVPAPDGLGLLCVRVCTRAHGGRVRFSTSPLGGACVEVHLAPAPPLHA